MMMAHHFPPPICFNTVLFWCLFYIFYLAGIFFSLLTFLIAVISKLCPKKMGGYVPVILVISEVEVRRIG